MASTDLDMDLIFASAPPDSTTVSTHHEETHKVSNRRETHESIHKTTHTHGDERVVSTVSDHLYVDHGHDDHHTHVPEVNHNYKAYDTIADDLMESVFAAVKLEPVILTKTANNDYYHDDGFYSHEARSEHNRHSADLHPEHFVSQVEHAFEGIGDDESVYSRRSSAHHTKQSERHSHRGSGYDSHFGAHRQSESHRGSDYDSHFGAHRQPESHHGSHVQSVHHKTPVASNRVSKNTSVVSGNSRARTQASDFKARSEKRNSAYSYGEPRGRSMTFDTVTTAHVSRVGGFDLVDDNGRELGSQINLNHNEVAYQRPKPARTHKHHDHHSHANGKSNEYRHPLVAGHKNVDIQHENLHLELVNAALRQTKLNQAEYERLITLKTEEVRKACDEVNALADQCREEIGSSRHSNYSHRQQHRNDHHESSHAHNHHHHHHHHHDHHYSNNSSVEEQAKEIDIAEEVEISEVAGRQLEHGTEIGVIDNHRIIAPWVEEQVNYSKNKKIKKVIVGGHAHKTDEDRTVLLFGPVGQGKTSTVNSILNYLFDVKKEHDFRFTLTPNQSKTTELTVYVINNSILPYSVTLIDTPGVPDQENNTFVSHLIEKWLQQELLTAGAARIDAISIVLNTNIKSMAWPFIGELAYVKRLFGNDLKTNVLPIITNSEVLPQPTAIRALTAANVGFFEYYKVNNLGFLPSNHSVSKLKHNLYFTHGVATFERYFRDLQEAIHPLLAVLRGRDHHHNPHDIY
ncbi:unnamed protein product [Auanema sp. JU1783]|nr:unnamed protein product [Auanema sp. JU1783]